MLFTVVIEKIWAPRTADKAKREVCYSVNSSLYCFTCAAAYSLWKRNIKQKIARGIKSIPRDGCINLPINSFAPTPYTQGTRELKQSKLPSILFLFNSGTLKVLTSK